MSESRPGLAPSRQRASSRR